MLLVPFSLDYTQPTQAVMFPLLFFLKQKERVQATASLKCLGFSEKPLEGGPCTQSVGMQTQGTATSSFPEGSGWQEVP